MNQFRRLVENIINETTRGYDNYIITKQKMIDGIYLHVSGNEMQKIYRDEYWQGYSDILDYLKKIGFEVISAPANDSNHKSGYSLDGKEKTWDVTLEKDGITIHGIIKAFAAGTVEDPFNAYDMAMILW